MRVIALAVVLVTLMPLVAQSQQNHPRDDHGVGVSVLGEVAAPGRYEFRNCTTILDALAAAGGFKQFAPKIVLLRPEGPTMKRIPYNPFWWEEWGEDACLHQGDMIFVQ
jgi:SLBB domain